MKVALIIVLAGAAALCGCGFIRNARLCEQYIGHMVPEEPQINIVIWPFHLVMLTCCAAIDQFITTFEIFKPAAVDGYDYLIMRGNGNNILFERSVMIPKTLATPVIFTGSYVMRWLFPIEHDARPFQMK